ncbi:MAG: phosphoglycerate kinase [Chloroflexota bacterium]|nr:phosphoglycerate kinase [Chloroflexota bacterium]MDE2919156.1 phosphoglycerate kinase [Chloroflexota bacterium]
MKRGSHTLEVGGRRVFLRVDANVPLKGGAIRDDTRLRAVVPTLADLRARGARLVVASHLGRPKGKPESALSLAPVAERLAELLGCAVALAPDSVGAAVEAQAGRLADGEVLLLENLRFHPGEEQNDPSHATALTRLADVYINDAFGTAHRAHASTVGVARLLPAAAGPVMHAEIRALDRATREPARPYVAVLGGAKVSDKIGVLRKLATQVDALLLGGGIANTFLASAGGALGRSLVEPGQAETVAAVRAAAAASGCRILLPDDAVAAATIDPDAATTVVPAGKVPDDRMALDIGPTATTAYLEVLAEARTVVWNGPLGVYEHAPFAQGTLAVAQGLAESSAFVVVAGGDALAAAQAAGVADRMGHLSTGGGATLEFLEGRELPGLAALPDA